ncbi:polyprenyl synthetase family protein [Flindersiella endophytica]
MADCGRPAPSGSRLTGVSQDDVRHRVDEALEAFLARRSTELADIDAELAPQLKVVADLTAGGKRLRPLFCYWGWRGAGGAPDEPGIIQAAAALELLQASALVHDDVMDNSDLRRGKPAAHRQFASMHTERGWEGPSDWFGAGGAILLGDLCLCWADQMLRECGLPAERLFPAFGYFDIMRTEVMAGQYLDLVSQASGRSSQTQAMRVVRFKSAKYTIERPLHIGGALTGAPPELLAAYSSFGLPLGEAFQLRDDVLGVFGDPGVTGKPAGDDLREGKRTVLIAKTLDAAAPEQVERFGHCFGNPELDADGVADLREIIVATGALAAVERLIAELAETAHAALAETPLADEAAREALTELAYASTQRSG